MALRKRPPLPADLGPAYASFMDCVDVIEAGRRLLIGTLPTGRVEPTPIGIGLDAVAAAITDARGWMPGWKNVDLGDVWQTCSAGLDEAERQISPARDVAATTRELQELLDAVTEVVDALAVFGEAERAWRARWRLPRP